MKPALFLVCLTSVALARLPVSGQTADQLVTAGRLALTTRNLTNANASFASAVTTASDHPIANTLYAATRLLSLPNQPAGAAFLDRLGLSQTNRSIYHWRTSVPRGTDGIPLIPAGLNASEFTAFLRTNILPAITASGANLAKVTDPSFVLSLTRAETTLNDVAVDYGDILLLRAGLHFVEYLAYTINSWNVDAQLATIRSLLTNGATTTESFLAQFPDLFTFATTNDLAAARQTFSSGVALYVAASGFIRARPANMTRLFNYDPEMAGKEANFRTTLTELNQSLNGPVVLTLNTNLTVNLGPHFSGANPLRSFLPEFSGDAIIAGSLPDATFSGLLQGPAPYEVERLLGSEKHFGSKRLPALPFVSRFSVPRRLPDGRFQIALNALDESFCVVQVSSDLESWTDLAFATAQGGVIAFEDPDAAGSLHRFYRAVDQSKTVTANGAVFDVSTRIPIPNALVSLSFPFSSLPAVTNRSDSAGRYFAIAPVPPNSYVSYQLDVVAPGYSPFRYSGYSWANPHVTLPVYLAPPGFRPPNDDFSKRQVLSGSNVTAGGFNVGATMEPGEPFHAGSAGGKSVWWTWTALADGAVSVDSAGSSFDTLLAIYTGNSLFALTPVASAANFGNGPASAVNFFVRAGVTYQIAVDGPNAASGVVALNLRTVAPMPPQITSQPASQTSGEGNYAAFSVSAVGTAPLSFQWLKEGTAIPGATDTYYAIFSTRTSDAGVYSVVVTNAAGNVTSANAILTVQSIAP